MAHEDGLLALLRLPSTSSCSSCPILVLAEILPAPVRRAGKGVGPGLVSAGRLLLHQGPLPPNAGKKAFILNRFGDFGFLLAMFLIIAHFGSLELRRGLCRHQAATLPGCTAASSPPSALLLLVGAAGKSAQIPLYVWLPDAMEGPTPVSALIHAATMVTAGVYMVARCHYAIRPLALCSSYRRGLHRRGYGHLCRLHRAWFSMTSSASWLTPPSPSLAICSWPAALEPTTAGNLPRSHPRLLQGAALPRCRLRHPRPLRRAGYAGHGRPPEAHPGHLLDHDDGRLRHRRYSAARRLLLQG